MVLISSSEDKFDTPAAFKFAGTGFRLWQQKILFALELRDLDDVVLKRKTDEVHLQANKKARAFICSHLEDHVLQSVLQQEFKFGADIWDFLISRYDVSSRSERGRTSREFWQCDKDKSSCQDYITLLQTKAANARAVGASICDEEIINKLLCSMPIEFNSIISQFDQHDDIKLTELVTALISEERRLQSQTYSHESVHMTQIDLLKSRIAELEAGATTPIVICSHCKKRGHRKDQCWKLNPELRPNRFLKSNTQQEVHAYSSTLPTSSTESNQSTDWLLDCGCSHHMSPYVPEAKPVSVNSGVLMGNNDSVPIVGRGSKSIDLHSHCLVLDDVLHVPKLGQNLLSIGQSTGRGLKFVFEDDICNIYTKETMLTASSRPFVTVMKGNDNLYHTSQDVGKVSMQTNYAKRQVKTRSYDLWHQRLAHLNPHDVYILAKHPDSRIGVEASRSERPCEGCALGKMTRGKFYPANRRSDDLSVLEVSVIDLSGRIPTSSHNGSWYWMIILDRKEGWRDIHFLRSKSEAENIIIQHDQKSVRRLGNRTYRIQTIRTDNGGEFISNRLKEYFFQNGITHETIIPHVHEQVGDVERENRTLFEKAQCMRLSSGLPDEFWAETMETAAYIANRSPSSTRNFKSPFELRYGKVPCLSHLRVFGCQAWSHIPKTQRSKLQPRARSAIFVGYEQNRKGYRLFDMKTREFFSSRDVIFDESSFPAKKWCSETSQRLPHDSGMFDLIEKHSPRTQVCDRLEETDQIPFPESPQTDDEDNESRATRSSDVSDDPQDKPIEQTEMTGRPVRKRNPPGEWWKVNFAHAVDDEQLLVENRRNVLSNNEMLNNRTAWSCLLMNIRHPYSIDEFVLHSDVFSPSIEGVMASDIPIPSSMTEALDSKWKQYWERAAQQEYKTLIDRNTWELTSLPADRKPIRCKWVFAVKSTPAGLIEKFKARLVVKGFSQRPGIDFNETFSPVAHAESQRLILAIAVQFNLHLRQADIVSAFLNGDLDKSIYMTQPEGFTERNAEEFVCRLNKGLYGLKQAGLLWNKRLNQFLETNLGLTRTQADPCFYVKRTQDGIILLSLHVDDMLFAFSCEKEVQIMFNELHKEFGITDLGEPEKVLGIRIRRNSAGHIFCDQEIYIEETLKRFNMEHCSGTSLPHQSQLYLTTSDSCLESGQLPYSELVGSLNYIATRTRPDISYIVSNLCRFISKPAKEHWEAAKRVLRYLKATKTKGIQFCNSDPLIGYSDSNFAGDPECRRSTSGVVFTMSGGPISWKSQLQKSTALSALEAEYQALSLAAREATWLKQLIQEIGFHGQSPVLIFGDNQGCQHVASNRKTDARTKHIQVRFHYTRDRIEDKTILLRYLESHLMPADFLTKPIDFKKFQWCREKIGICDFDFRGRVEMNPKSALQKNSEGNIQVGSDKNRARAQPAQNSVAQKSDAEISNIRTAH